MRLILCSCLLLAIQGTAVGEKITVDPNTPAVVSKAENNVKLDARLAAKVTYTALSEPVREVLGDLSSMTGVKLYAGYNNQDWQVRDRRMDIFATDITLAQLMNSIARAMKFKWSKNEEIKPTTYRLYMDRSSLLEEQMLLKKQAEDIKRKKDEARSRVMRSYENADQLTEAQIDGLKESDPRLYLDMKSGAAAPFAKFLKAAPHVRDIYSNGGTIKLTGNDLSPQQQQALIELMRGFEQKNKFEHSLRDLRHSDPDDPAVPQDIANKMDKVTVVASTYPFLDGDPTYVCSLGTFQLVVGGTIQDFEFAGQIDLYDNGDDQLRLLAKQQIGIFEKHAFGQKENDDLHKQALVTLAKRSNNVPGEPLIEHGQDEQLAQEVKADFKTNNHRDVLRTLSEAVPYAMVSDDFGKLTSAQGSMPSGKQAIRKCLDAVQDNYCYNWDRHGPVLEFRDRKWFNKRSVQIPDAWIDRWRNTFKKTGTLDIDDLAEIARLGSDQFDANLLDDEGFDGLALQYLRMTSARDAIPLYAGLDPQQRAMLLSDAGLTADSLAGGQSRLFISMAMGWFAQGFRTDSADGIVLHATRTAKGKSFEYKFSMTHTKRDLKPITIEFATPDYESYSKRRKAAAQQH